MDIELAQALKEIADLKEEKRINEWVSLKGGLKVVYNKNIEMHEELEEAKKLLQKCYDNYIYLQPLRSEIEQFLNRQEVKPSDRFEITEKGKEYLSSH
jgi:hypothetical protein